MKSGLDSVVRPEDEQNFT